MKLLHHQSILISSELDEAIHHAEMEKIKATVYDLPDYDCEIEITFEDEYHKEMNLPLFYESNLHRIGEFLETQDIKNGADALLTDDHHLAFRAFGQNYTHQGKDGILTTLITVKSYGEGMVPVDMSKVFTPPMPNQEKTLSI